MNIFELILSEPQSYQPGDFAGQLGSWTQFRATTAALFAARSDAEALLVRSRDLWAAVRKNSPELLPVMIDYYLNELEKTVTGPLAASLKAVEARGGSAGQVILGILEGVKEVYGLHERYIALFDQEGRWAGMLRAMICGLLEQLQLKQRTGEHLKSCFHRHCLNVLTSEVLEFQEGTSNYIQERYAPTAEPALSLPSLRKILEHLSDLQLLEDYFEDTYCYFNRESEQFIGTCEDPSERGQFLARCLAFERSFQKGFLKSVKGVRTEGYFTFLINQLDDNVYYLWAKYCCSNILDIVVDFPDSLPTIVSLKKCLDRAPLLSEIGEQLSRQVERRLLIPGVITQNILNQYINMLKVLQVVDPQGLVFEKITVPIKNYLLKRNDTLRCIISTLTDDVENYSKLTREVVKIPSKEYIEEMSSEEDENAAKEWQVLQESKTKKRVKYQEIDLVTVLVGLYGSQEAFICEYQNMMAEKLMSARDYSIDEEVRNIELLKMRFGESALQTCNIIVKDVKDSKRNDAVVHNSRPNFASPALPLASLNILAVSKGYWPINYETASAFQVPNDLQAVFAEYSKAFSQIKAMRKIFYHYNLGHVNLSLSFDNGTFEFKCLPLQAILISYFDEGRLRDAKNGISSEQLSNELKVAHNVLKQKMSFWVHKGVLKESRVARNAASIRRLNSLEDGEAVHYKPVAVYENAIKEEIDDDLESTLLKESTSMESHLRHIIEGLILSILNTNGPKSPEKIHLLLKTVYKTDLDYTYGEAQTVDILKKMLHKKKVEFNGEVYSSREEAVIGVSEVALLHYYMRHRPDFPLRHQHPTPPSRHVILLPNRRLPQQRIEHQFDDSAISRTPKAHLTSHALLATPEPPASEEESRKERIKTKIKSQVRERIKQLSREWSLRKPPELTLSGRAQPRSVQHSSTDIFTEQFFERGSLGNILGKCVAEHIHLRQKEVFRQTKYRSRLLSTVQRSPLAPSARYPTPKLLPGRFKMSSPCLEVGEGVEPWRYSEDEPNC